MPNFNQASLNLGGQDSRLFILNSDPGQAENEVVLRLLSYNCATFSSKKSSDCILLTLNILFILLQSKLPGNLDLFLLSMLYKSLNEVIRVCLFY